MNGASFDVTYNIYVRLTFEKAYNAMLTTPVEPDDGSPARRVRERARLARRGTRFWIGHEGWEYLDWDASGRHSWSSASSCGAARSSAR